MEIKKSSTIPFFQTNSFGEETECEGSAVLVTFQRRHFVVTAAHVFDDLRNDFRLGTLGKVAPLGKCDVYRTYKDDIRDFGCFEIGSDVAEALTELHRFVSLPEKCEVPEIPFFVMKGYPVYANPETKPVARKITRMEFTLVKNDSFLVHDLEYKKAKDDFLALQIRPDAFSEGHKPFYNPDLRGFSGGGFYYLLPWGEPFAGVLLKSHWQSNRRKQVILGLRAEVICKFLRSWFF